MSAMEKNQYWISGVDISKRVITKEIQFLLGPDATVRPFTHEGQDGFLISTPGECLTDEQIDDICCKSREVWEKQAAVKDPERQLKRPLNKPILVSRATKTQSYTNDRSSGSSRRRSPDQRYEGSSRYR